MHDAVALGREENQDGEEETNEGPGCGESQEDVIVELFARDFEKGEAGENGSSERDAKEDTYTGCNCGVRYADR